MALKKGNFTRAQAKADSWEGLLEKLKIGACRVIFSGRSSVLTLVTDFPVVHAHFLEPLKMMWRAATENDVASSKLTLITYRNLPIS